MSNNKSDSIKNYELIKNRLESELKESLAKGDTTNLLKIAEKLKLFIEETKKSLELEVKECLERGDTDGMLKAADVLKEFVERVEKADDSTEPAPNENQAKVESSAAQKREEAKPITNKVVDPPREEVKTKSKKEEKKNNEGVGGFIKLFFNTKSFLDEGSEQSSKAKSSSASQKNESAPDEPTPAKETGKKIDSAQEVVDKTKDKDPKSPTEIKNENVDVQSKEEKIDVTEFASWANNLTKKKSEKTTAAVTDLIASLEESVDNCNTISEKLMSETHLLEGTIEALGLLDCDCELMDSDSRAIRISQQGKLIGILKVASDLNNPTRKELGELCIEVTREWGKNGSEPKGIFLFNAIRRLDLESQDDTLTDKTIDDDFTSMAEKNGICLLALEQLLFIVGSASINKVKSEKIVSKIVSSNGVVEQNDIHLL